MLFPQTNAPSSPLSQGTSNANDPWSSWENTTAGDAWSTKPEARQKNSASNNWEAAAFGHPQAYQGPGQQTVIDKNFQEW